MAAGVLRSFGADFGPAPGAEWAAEREGGAGWNCECDGAYQFAGGTDRCDAEGDGGGCNRGLLVGDVVFRLVGFRETGALDVGYDANDLAHGRRVAGAKAGSEVLAEGILAGKEVLAEKLIPEFQIVVAELFAAAQD